MAAAAVLLLWEGAARAGWIDGRVFPPPSAVILALEGLARSGALWRDACASLGRVAVGFCAATAAGVPLGFATARVRLFDEAFSPLIEVLRPISVIAWLPIAVLWFGLGDRPAWFIIFLGAFFPIFSNAAAGFGGVDPGLLRAARSLGAGPWSLAREILWPAALPQILTGMRVGLGTGWTAVIAAEMISGQSGLGYMIQMARMMVETERVLAGMVAIGALGLGMNAALGRAGRALAPWQEERR